MLSIKLKTLLFLSYIFLLLFILEICSRFYFKYKENTPFFNYNLIVYKFYPELESVNSFPKNNKKHEFNVLLLGASVIKNDWSNTEELLRLKIGKSTSKDVRIQNLSELGHSSLDSLYKYQYLENVNFDLVIYYHGINELRANNIPEKFFKKDYSHYAWYKLINIYLKKQRINSIIFPRIINLLIYNINEKISPTPTVPIHIPKEEWMKFGSNIKTARTFRNNIQDIIDISKKKKEKLIIMTFAYNNLDNVDIYKNEYKYCYYKERKCPTAMWGLPNNVIKGLETHNNIIKETAEKSKEV